MQGKTASGTEIPGTAGLCYEIDAEDCIRSIDDNWSKFAQENDAAGLAQSDVIGKSLWDFISDDITVSLYRKIISRVRDGRTTRFRLRCDGPDCRRLLEMHMDSDAAGNVRFETLPIRIESRAPVALFSCRAKRSWDLLRVCAWCNRVHVSNGAAKWVEVEEAVRHLQLFEQQQLPQLTHGICGVCFAQMTETVEKLDS